MSIGPGTAGGAAGTAPPVLSALWIGDALRPLERACLRSALHHGHSVRLYCYDRPQGVPAGIELADAGEILPASAIVRHRDGSPSLFSNRFRYQLMRDRPGATWIDCDLYFVRPLADASPMLFGDQGGGKLNTAVFRLPPDSPLLEPLLDLFNERYVPPWLDWRSRGSAWFRRLRTGRTGIGLMPWGSTGPEAFTWLAQRAGLSALAAPPSRFYPVHWTDALWLLDRSRPLDAVVAPDTVCVHLWNERLRGVDLATAPEGSFAARLWQEGAA